VVVVNQQTVMLAVVVGPEVQDLALMQASEFHQIFLEIRLFTVRVVQDAEIQFSVLPRQHALEQARALMQ
jgi:hypothetical protein